MIHILSRIDSVGIMQNTRSLRPRWFRLLGLPTPMGKAEWCGKAGSSAAPDGTDGTELFISHPAAGAKTLNLGKIGTNLGRIGMNVGRIRPNSGKIRPNFDRFTLNLGRITPILGKITLIFGKIETNLVAGTQNDVIRCPTPLPVMMMVMKSRPKLRTFIRWMLTILTVMFVVVWIGSGWYDLGCSPYWSLGKGKTVLGLHIQRGCCYISVDRGAWNWTGPPGVYTNMRRKRVDEMHHWIWVWQDLSAYTGVVFPAWIPPLLLTLPTALMWRTHIIARRRKPGMCTKCGYDIAGLVGKEACPECGTRIKSEIAPAKA